MSVPVYPKAENRNKMKVVASDIKKQALTMGFLTGAMTIPFLEWVHRAANYPIKFALRGAEPFAYVAYELHAWNPAEFPKFKDAVSIWVNRQVVRAPGFGGEERDEELYKEYLRRKNLNKEWTIVDTGLTGRTVGNLGSEYRPRQILFFSSDNYNIRGFMNEWPYSDDLCRAIGCPPSFPKNLSDYEWSVVYSKITNFLDAAPKIIETPSRMVERDGRVEPDIAGESAVAAVLRGDYWRGLDNAVADFRDGKELPAVGRIMGDLFKNNIIADFIRLIDRSM
jgi:hypothetical protein